MVKNMVKLVLPLGHDDYEVYCPVCGKDVFTCNNCDGCPHVIFTHLRNVEDDDFHYLSNSVQKIARKAEREGQDPLEAVTAAVSNRTSVLMFSILSTSVFMGQSKNSTVTIGIDFAPKAKSSDFLSKRKAVRAQKK